MAKDNPQATESKLEQALHAADAVISSGGVSMGKLDLVKPQLERRGVIHFGRVTMKPGKPVTFVTVGDTPVFALPGFPVSSLVSFEYLCGRPCCVWPGMPWGTAKNPDYARARHST